MGKKKAEKQAARVVMLYCQNCIKPGAERDLASASSMQAVMMPCSSKVQIPHILKILAEGAAGVEVVACPEKACRFLVGSCKAEKRINRVRELLAMAGLSPQRAGLTRGADLSADDLAGFAAARLDAIADEKDTETEGDNS